MKGLFWKFRGRAGGQSLAETAIFLPVIIFMLLGVVEVSNLLVTQNRVSAAARAATGFAATNFTGDEWTDTDAWSDAMVRVARNNVTDTLDLDEQRWDIWTIKATVNDMGDGFTQWEDIHAFGDNAVMTQDEWKNANVEGDVLTALRENGDDLTKDLEIVATVAYHNRQSLLGLKAYNLGEFTRIRGLNVMRVAPKPDTAGCALFPISLFIENLSLYPENYAGTMVDNATMYESNPAPGGWTYPTTPPVYNDNPYDHSSFPFAVGGHTLKEANRGDIFEAREKNFPATLGAFGWITWDGKTDSGSLSASLDYPGNLSLVKPPPTGMINYENPYDPKDYIPSIGDWAQGATGAMNSSSVVADLEHYVNEGLVVQIVVFDQVQAAGANFNYRIAGFALVKLVAFQKTGSEPGILVEFIDWGKQCERQLANK